MFIRSKKAKDKVYLQLVESRWIEGKCRQVVLRSLGRLDTLQESGQLDSLLISGMKFSHRLAVLDAHKKGQCLETKSEYLSLSCSKYSVRILHILLKRSYRNL